MEIDEVQCAKGGNVGRVSFQTQYMCGGQFEGVNVGSPLGQRRSYESEREREAYFLAVCSFERIHVLAL